MSGEKERVAVTLSPENVEWLDERYNNRSAFIDDLLTQAKDGNGRADEAVRELRIQQLEEEADDLEAKAESLKRQAERKRAKAEQLREENKVANKQATAKLEEARDALQHTPLEPDNPAVEKWATDLGITPGELIEKLQDGDAE